VDQAVVDKLKE
jgi:hypothetical protein